MPSKYPKWKGKTGKYRCTLTFNERGKKWTEERDVWLCRNESMRLHITEVHEMIPGTDKASWTHDLNDEGVDRLMCALYEKAVDDVRLPHEYIAKYPKEHQRLHFKLRTEAQQEYWRRLKNEEKSARGFLAGTEVLKKIDSDLSRKGMGYDIHKV